MKKYLPKILFVLVIGGVTFIVYSIVRAFMNGERALKNLALAPFYAAGDAIAAVKKLSDATWAKIGGTVAPIAALPGLTQQEQQLHDTTLATATSDYAPGGRIYNRILAEQGKDAADRSWQAVQSDYALEAASVESDSSIWGWFGL